MSKKLAGQFAAAQAEQLIQDLGLKSLPIDPFKIAEQHDIMVVAKPASFEGVSGFITKLGDNFVIAHATHIKSDGFIRFTVAHELGHYFLPEHPERLFGGHDGIHHSKSGFIDGDITEIEADHFAAALLMPEELFRAAMQNCRSGYEAIKELARLCRTSITATAIRYAIFSDEPVAVVVSSGRNINYCFMSESLKSIRGIQWIKKGELVPPSSTTAEFNRDPENVKLALEDEGWSKLDHWFDGAPDFDVKEDVVGLGTYGKTLTVLFKDDSGADADDDYDDDMEDDD